VSKLGGPDDEPIFYTGDSTDEPTDRSRTIRSQAPRPARSPP